jgi:hypothetical protein
VPSTVEALGAVASAIVNLEVAVEWAQGRASDSPGGQDEVALASYARGWAVRLGIEVVDALAAETDRTIVGAVE